MTLEKWQDILALVKDKFEVEEEGREELADVPHATVEYVVFDGPLGRMRLEFAVKPVVLDKKAIGSKRIGSETTVEYVYSDTEFTHTFKAYVWDAPTETWVEMEQEKSPFNF